MASRFWQQVIPPIFVLSPLEHIERREKIQEHLKEFDIKPIFFNAIHGQTMGLRCVYDDANRRYSRLTPDRVAVWIGHWFLWQHIYLSKIPVAIILEDDARLSSDFIEQFKERMWRTPVGWDVVYLGITFPERMFDRRIGVNLAASGVFQFVKAATWDGCIDGAWAYMVTWNAASQFVKQKFVMHEPWDRWVSIEFLHKVRTYIWHPAVAYHS